MQRMTFTGVQGREYVAAPDHRALIGHSRIRDVVSASGGRMPRSTANESTCSPKVSSLRPEHPLVVTRVEGARIFVRPRSERHAQELKRP